MKKLQCIFTLVLLIIINNLMGQVRISVPFGLFYGDGIEKTSYQPIININSFCVYNKYIPIDFEEKNYLISEIGIGAIGTKQSSYETKIFGIKAGIFYRHDFLKPEFSPFALTGLNLNILFANKSGFEHRVFLPEYMFGIGISFGNFSFDIRDNIGLISVDKDKSIKSNVISVGFNLHLRDFM